MVAAPFFRIKAVVALVERKGVERPFPTALPVFRTKNTPVGEKFEMDRLSWPGGSWFYGAENGREGETRRARSSIYSPRPFSLVGS